MMLHAHLSRLRQRAVRIDAGRGSLVALAAAALGAELAWAFHGPVALIGGLLAASGAGFAVWRASRRAPDVRAVAARVDRLGGLHDLVASAIDPGTAASPMAPILVDEATAAAGRVAPHVAYPWRWPHASARAIALIVAAQALTVAARWTSPALVDVSSSGMPALPSSPGAPPGQATSAARPGPNDTPEASRTSQAAARPAAPVPGSTTNTDPVNGVASGAGRGGAVTGATGSASPAVRIPVLYRDIVGRYFSQRTAAASAGKRPHP